MLFLGWVPGLNTRKQEPKQGSCSVDWWSAYNCLCESVKVQYVYFCMSMCLNISYMRIFLSQPFAYSKLDFLRHLRATGLIYLCRLKWKDVEYIYEHSITHRPLLAANWNGGFFLFLYESLSNFSESSVTSPYLPTIYPFYLSPALLFFCICSFCAWNIYLSLIQDFSWLLLFEGLSLC